MQVIYQKYKLSLKNTSYLLKIQVISQKYKLSIEHMQSGKTTGRKRENRGKRPGKERESHDPKISHRRSQISRPIVLDFPAPDMISRPISHQISWISRSISWIPI